MFQFTVKADRAPLSFPGVHDKVSPQSNVEMEDTKMYDCSKTFFSSKRAETFTTEFQAQGIETIIVSERDYLNAGGTLYYVKWNIE